MIDFIIQHQWIVWLAFFWSLPWKMIAVWKAAKNNHLIWFIVLFLFNTFAILEIAYIFFFEKRKKQIISSKKIFSQENEFRKIV